MLTGQTIGIMDSIYISITGLGIVMAELGLLALFVAVMSKILAPFAKNGDAQKAKAPKAAAAAAPAPAPPAPPQIQPAAIPVQNDTDDVYAAIIAAVCEESGMSPEEFVVTSIQEF